MSYFVILSEPVTALHELVPEKADMCGGTTEACQAKAQNDAKQGPWR
jgi:hypothetical protein